MTNINFPSDEELRNLRKEGATSMARAIAASASLQPNPSFYLDQRIREAEQSENYELAAKLMEEKQKRYGNN